MGKVQVKLDNPLLKNIYYLSHKAYRDIVSSAKENNNYSKRYLCLELKWHFKHLSHWNEILLSTWNKCCPSLMLYNLSSPSPLDDVVILSCCPLACVIGSIKLFPESKPTPRTCSHVILMSDIDVFVMPICLLISHVIWETLDSVDVYWSLSLSLSAEIQSCLVSSGDVGCGTFQCFNNNSCEIQGLHHICLTLLHNAGRYDSQVGWSTTIKQNKKIQRGI